MYKIIALDLDGTLTNARKEITPRTKEVLMQAQERGVRIVLASGRPPYGIMPLARQLELERFGGFVLAYNGGLILNTQTQDRLFEEPLSVEHLPYLCRKAKDAGFTIMTYKDDEILTENPQDIYVQRASFINKIKVTQVHDFQTEVKAPIYKCLIVGEPEKLQVLEKSMAQEMQGKLNIFRSEPYFMEVVPTGIDKAHSLDCLMCRLNLTAQDLMAVGDGWNDVSMIRYAGLGVAMANAQHEVKAVADYITLHTNEEDGVAEVVERFCL